MAVDRCWPLTPLRCLSSRRPQNQGLMSTPPTPVLFRIPPVSDYSDIIRQIDLFKMIFQHDSLFLKRLFKTLDKFGYVTFHGYQDRLEIEAKDELIYSVVEYHYAYQSGFGLAIWLQDTSSYHQDTSMML